MLHSVGPYPAAYRLRRGLLRASRAVVGLLLTLVCADAVLAQSSPPEGWGGGTTLVSDYNVWDKLSHIYNFMQTWITSIATDLAVIINNLAEGFAGVFSRMTAYVNGAFTNLVAFGSSCLSWIAAFPHYASWSATAALVGVAAFVGGVIVDQLPAVTALPNGAIQTSEMWRWICAIVPFGSIAAFFGWLSSIMLLWMTWGTLMRGFRLIR